MPEDANKPEEMQPVEKNREPAAAVESDDDDDKKRVGTHIFIFITGALVAMILAGTVTYWFRSYQPGTVVQISLWNVDTDTTATGRVTTTTGSLCTVAARLFTGAQAFSVISSILVVAAFALGIVNFVTGKFGLVATAISVLLFITTIIAWALPIRVYQEQYCSASSLREMGYDLGPGPFLMFLSSVFVIFAILAMIIDPALPRTKVQIRRTTGTLFAIAGFISTVLCTLGCGITMWKYSGSGTSVEVSIWKTVSAGNTMKNFDIDCFDLARQFKIAAAFSISSAVLSLLCLIFGLLRMCAKIPVALPLVFGGLTSIATLITWGVLTNIWGTRFCNAMDTYEQQFYVRMPGYGFFVASFCEILVATIIVVIGSVRSRNPETTFPVFNVILFWTTFGAAVFGTVAMPSPFFASVDSGNGNAYAKAYLWYVDQQNAANTFTHSGDLGVYFSCEATGTMFKAVRYLQLVGVILSVVATILVFFLFKFPKIRIAVIVVNYIVSLMFGIALLLWIILLQYAFCNDTSVASLGFGVSSGAGLQVIGFFLTLFGAVLPCLPEESKSE